MDEQRTSLEMYNNALGLGTHDDGVQGVLADVFANEESRRGTSGEGNDATLPRAVGQDVYRRDKRERRPNIRLDIDAVNAERMLKLQRSRSGHQGHLTELNNKISVLLYDSKNVEAVKELVELFNRQWERFNLIHNEILLFADREPSTVASVMHAYDDQLARKTELLNKVTNYLQSRERENPLPDDLETRSNASISSFNSLASAKSIASSKSRETRLKRERAELCMKQLQDRRDLERNIELRKLEMRQAIEQQRLNDEIEIAKLEERYAVEEERRLCNDEKLYEHVDFTKNYEAAPKFEYRYASPPKFVSSETKGHFHFDEPKQNNPVTYRTGENADANAIQQLAETLANLSHTPPIEITKFTGDPKDYLRFVTRFSDQVLSQPIQESKKLSRLMQYLDGKAKEAVERYEGMGSGALLDALSVLKYRFGQPYMIVDAFIVSIVKGPSIANGDGKSLQKLADKCQSVLKTLESMRSLNEINTDHIRKVVARLPYYNQSRWRDRASDILRERGTPPGFQDLTEFLQRRAQSENNPLYGNLGNPVKDNANRTKKEKPISSFATQYGFERPSGHAYERGTVCPVCKGDHNLLVCKKFLHMPTVERRKIVLESRLCFQCLSTGHYKRFCKQSRCQVKSCNRRHHELLHLASTKEREISTHRQDAKVDEVTKRDAQVQTNTANILPQVNRGTTALPVVAVKIHGADGLETTTFALLDQASEASFIHTSLAKRLNLRGSKGTVSVKTLTGTTSIEAEKVDVILESANWANHDSRLVARDVIVTDSLDVQLKVAPTKDDVQVWEHLSDIDFPAVELEDILVLIGADNPEVFITEEIRTGGTDEPWGFKYKLGWALMGPTNRPQTNQVDVHLLQRSSADIEEAAFKEEVIRFFHEDGLGVVTSIKKAMSVEDKKAEKVMERSAVIVDGHYEIGMLWKDETPQLPNNRDVAFKRFKYLKNRLKRDNELHRKYQTKIEEYVQKGYASKLQPEETNIASERIWYLPHHPVFHPAKPGKVRIVFDAAAKFKGTSLNDKLVHGPNLSNEIIEVLLRFRKEEVAIAADVQEMFHQVKVPEIDRQSLRFLWSPGLDDPEEYHMNVHIFGAKDSPSIANYALKKTARDNTCDFSETAVKAVEKDFYVDDLLKSLPNEKEAIQVASDLMELLRRGGFRLTKWISSSKKVLASIPKSERADPTWNLDLDNLPVLRALGLQWNVEEDVFEFKVIDLDKPETKRGILSTVASLYDPLGFAAPVTLLAKSLLQRLWQTKADWDERLAEAELEDWIRWKKGLSSLSKVKIPRCYKTDVVANDKVEDCEMAKCVKEVQLHNFSDASEIGYGSASYIRTEFIDGRVTCSLVFGKSRTAPLRKISIPRLELQAAVLSVRISEIIQREVEITFNKICYWTDSEVVLKYIQNEDKRFTVYVGNRLSEIREKSEVHQWRYCPSKDNPSDDASRGLKPADVTSECRWLTGPSFLKDPESCWPRTNLGKDIEDDPEILIQSNVVVEVKRPVIYELLERYSSWYVLKVKIVWLTRFKLFLSRRLQLRPFGRPTISELEKRRERHHENDPEASVFRRIQCTE